MSKLKSKKKMRQFQLRSGNAHTTCWLEDDKRLKEGNSVTLKSSDEPKRLWEIVGRGDSTKNLSDIHSDWNVGGI